MLREKQVGLAEECTVKRNEVEQHKVKRSVLHGSLNGSLSYAAGLLYVAEFTSSVLFLSILRWRFAKLVYGFHKYLKY